MRLSAILCGVMGLALVTDVKADSAGLTYGGYQPWWNMIAARDKRPAREQARLQRFWHDYYRNLQVYYGMMEKMDWVSYYKNHGTPLGAVQGRCGGPSSMQMAPLEIAPAVPWDITRNASPPWSPRDVPWGPRH